MTTFILTRPRDDSAKMAETFAAHGIHVIQSPLLEIAYKQPPPAVFFDGVKGVILTSRHGISALKHAEPETPLIVVGESLMQNLQKLGFERVIYGGEDGKTLIHTLKAFDGPLLYLAGDPVRYDLALSLPHLHIQKHVVYESHPCSLTEDAYQALKSPCWVALFSVRTADIFKKALQRDNMDPSCISVISFSPSITGHLGNICFKKISTCKKPAIKAFWDIVETDVFRYTRPNL